MSAYLRSVRQSLLRSDEAHLAVTLTGHEDHALGLYAADLPWLEIRQNAYLAAEHLLRSIVFGYA